MEFRVEPTPLSRRRSRRILAVTGAIVVSVAVIVGALAAGAARPTPFAAVTATTSAPSPTARQTEPSPSPAPVVAPTGPPPRVVCHAVAAGSCSAIADAALAAAADPALAWPTEVDVWASLLCGSVFDCPPDRLTGRRAAGSAVVVAGTIRLWVNVLEPAVGSSQDALDAWVIHSGPVG
jgi:hypothetical protein